MTTNQLAFGPFPEEDVSGNMIIAALKKCCSCRHVALRKPALTLEHRPARLQGAFDHVNWTIKQWEAIL